VGDATASIVTIVTTEHDRVHLYLRDGTDILGPEVTS